MRALLYWVGWFVAFVPFAIAGAMEAAARRFRAR